MRQLGARGQVKVKTDWIMKNTNNTRNLRWKFTAVSKNFDYAHDIAVLSSRHKDLQEKCNRLHQVSRFTGNLINTTKTKGAEMWRITSADIEQLDVFHRKCLRRILSIFWPHTISNCDLYKGSRERPISETPEGQPMETDRFFVKERERQQLPSCSYMENEGKRRRVRP
ncbi:hypothetical protein ACROYT_G041435 [Oculina patagonica]